MLYQLFIFSHLKSAFFYYGFYRFFLIINEIPLKKDIFLQKEEEVFCSDVNMSELSCPKLLFWQREWN